MVLVNSSTLELTVMPFGVLTVRSSRAGLISPRSRAPAKLAVPEAGCAPCVICHLGPWVAGLQLFVLKQIKF